MVLSLPQGNHVAKFGKDPIYRTKVIVRKPVWTPAPPAIPNHIIRPDSRRAYKNELKHLNGDHHLGFRSEPTSQICYRLNPSISCG